MAVCVRKGLATLVDPAGGMMEFLINPQALAPVPNFSSLACKPTLSLMQYPVCTQSTPCMWDCCLIE
eukprot:1142222-Pelagomonas_calceolata.AAC.2